MTCIVHSAHSAFSLFFYPRMHIGIVHVPIVNVANVLHLVVNVSGVHESYGVECPSTRQGPAIQACQRDRLGLGDALQASRPVLSSTNCYERLVSLPVFFSRILRDASPLHVTLGSIGLQALNSPASNPKTDRTTGEEVEQFNSCASKWTNTRNMGSAGDKDCILFSRFKCGNGVCCQCVYEYYGATLSPHSEEDAGRGV